MAWFSSRVFLVASFLSPGAFAVNTVSTSAFIASDNSVSFALNIPQADDSNDLYFAMSGPAHSSWIAVGMGSDKMDGSLIFMMYADSDGKNITLSPRLSNGNVEPSYTNSVGISVLPGSGISNGAMTANVLCTNCRSWGDHTLNPNDTQAQFIFGSADGSLESNSLSAGVTRHSSYGTFTMDLTKAYGKAGIPQGVITSDTSGTIQISETADNNFAPALHAAAMILAFVVLMPVGIFILRILNSPKWHGFNQVLSAVVALIGLFLGIYIGTMYNRSKNSQSPHQIFGIVIIVAMIAQSVLGFWHHRIYRRTLTTTKLAPVHVWLGRLVIPCGIANGFLGFPLALNSKYNLALLGLILLLLIVGLPFTFWGWKQNLRKSNANFAAGNDSDRGYQSQPWTATPSRSDIHLNQMHTNYPPTYNSATETRQFI